MGDDVMNLHNRVGLVLSPPLPGDIVRVIDVGDGPTPEGDPSNPVRRPPPRPARAARPQKQYPHLSAAAAHPPTRGSPPPPTPPTQARALADVVPGADALRVSAPSCGAPPRGGAPLPVAAAKWSADPAVTAAARAFMAARKGVQVDPAAVGVWEFSLPGAGAAGVAVGDAVQFDRRASAGGRVAGNNFHDSYDACIRLQASGTLLQGNTYERVPGGISVVFDDAWLEGSADIRGVTIADNVFVDVLSPPATSFAQILSADKGVQNLTLRNNTVRGA
jgi:hypothetical protein